MSSERAAQDIEMWNAWKANPTKQTLQPLLKAYDPVVHRFVSTYSHSGVPVIALEAEAKLNAVKAFQSYDPKMGTQLNTHVTNMLQKGQRLVYENKGLTRIPEHRAIRTSSYLSIRDFLKEKLDRDPSMAEMKEELCAGHPVGNDAQYAWTDNEIKRMETELRKTMLSSEDTLQNLQTQETSKDAKLIDFVYYELTPLEQHVYEHLTGRNGKPQLDGSQIAKQLKTTPSHVSKIRQKIADVFVKYRDMPVA
jgi:DNA-directed RNA polymerase specialized sigma subunit